MAGPYPGATYPQQKGSHPIIIHNYGPPNTSVISVINCLLGTEPLRQFFQSAAAGSYLCSKPFSNAFQNLFRMLPQQGELSDVTIMEEIKMLGIHNMHNEQEVLKTILLKLDEEFSEDKHPEMSISDIFFYTVMFTWECRGKKQTKETVPCTISCSPSELESHLEQISFPRTSCPCHHKEHKITNQQVISLPKIVILCLPDLKHYQILNARDIKKTYTRYHALKCTESFDFGNKKTKLIVFYCEDVVPMSHPLDHVNDRTQERKQTRVEPPDNGDRRNHGWHLRHNVKRPHSNVCGLRNLGNTCYMNSALQCLVHTEPLREFLLKKKSYKNEKLVKAFSEFVKEMWAPEGSPFIEPKTLKHVIATDAPIFRGNNQQDAQELVSLVIGNMQEELSKKQGMEGDITEIERIFYGKVQNSIICPGSCNDRKVTFDNIFPLTLPIPEREPGRRNFKPWHLRDCLESFTEDIPSDPWWCKKCQRETEFYRKTELWKLPQILMVYLKRFEEDWDFEADSMVNKKNCDPVNFDPNLCLDEYCAIDSEDIGKYTYDLYAVVNHTGSHLDFGHYYAFVKCDDKWFKCDDDRCMAARQIETSNAYVLFYMRTECDPFSRKERPQPSRDQRLEEMEISEVSNMVSVTYEKDKSLTDKVLQCLVHSKSLRVLPERILTKLLQTDHKDRFQSIKLILQESLKLVEESCNEGGVEDFRSLRVKPNCVCSQEMYCVVSQMHRSEKIDLEACFSCSTCYHSFAIPKLLILCLYPNYSFTAMDNKEPFHNYLQFDRYCTTRKSKQYNAYAFIERKDSEKCVVVNENNGKWSSDDISFKGEWDLSSEYILFFEEHLEQPSTSKDNQLWATTCVKRPSNDTSDLSQKKPTATEDDDMSTVNAHTKDPARLYSYICGLENPDENSSYMNSVLQCLVHTKPLREHFLYVHGPSVKDKDETNVASVFYHILNAMWTGRQKNFDASHLKDFVGSKGVANREFTTSFLNVLHEEMKEKRRPQERSVISDMFYGQMKRLVWCSKSKYHHNETLNYGAFPLTLEVPSVGAHLTKYLEAYTAIKQHNPQCPSCSTRNNFWELPPIVILFLQKNMPENFKFDFKLHLGRYSDNVPEKRKQYELYAVVYRLESNKYYACIKCDGKWFECNDTMCRPKPTDNVITRNTYILFYQLSV